MSWQYFRLGDILERKRIKAEIKPDEVYKLVTIKLHHQGVVLRHKKKGQDIKSNMYFVNEGDFILSGIDARNGAFGIVPKELDNAIVTNDFWCLEPKKEVLQKDFFLFLTSTSYFDYICKQCSDGTTQRIRLQKDKFYNYEITLPPIDEQEKLIQSLLKSKKTKEELSFELSHQLDLVKQLRQSFLREAMQGKLVPQNPNDEPASVLLEKIKAEKERLVKEKKIKKQKPLPPIKEEEIPFEIPENWVWCRLGEIVFDQVYGTSSKASLTGDIPVLRMGNITTDGKVFYTNLKYVSKGIKDLPKLYLENGDVVFNRTNSYELVGKCGVFENDEPYTLASYLIRIRFRKSLNPYFFSNYINCSLCRKTQIEPQIIQQNGQANFNGTKLANIIVPFPPLAEQHHIVTKLDELMHYCDQLEDQIKTSQQQNDQLLQQVLREALQPQPETEEEELPMAAELKVVYKKPKAHKVTSRKCDHAERAILAGHIINKTYREDFGRVKFQKLLHLTEYHCQIDIDSNYVQKVAGPYDRELLKDIESTLKRFRFFEIRESKHTGKRVTYRPLAAASELDNFFRKDFSKEAKRIDSLLNKFARFSYEECEIISTLYAVWNNRIIRKHPVTDDVLKQDFLEWDKHKAKYTDRLDKALRWMEKEDIIPVGWGKLIEKPVVQE